MSDFEIDAKDAQKILRRIERRTLGFSVAALKSALRYGLKVTRKTMVDKIRESVALKKEEINNEFLVEKKNLGGNEIGKQWVKVGVLNRPIAFIRLVVGSKNVPSQKDVRPKSREGVKVRIKPGQVIRDKGLFLAKVTAGKQEYVQVFRKVKKSRSRVGKGAHAPGLPIQKQALKSPHHIFTAKTAQDDVIGRIKPLVEKKFLEEFTKKIGRGFKIKF